jgi:hypothetical protein
MAQVFFLLVSFLLSLNNNFFASAHVVKRATVSPASNATLPGNWTYTGCYNDNQGGRTLSGSTYYDTANMNATSCIAFCSKKGYVYAGTEYSTECFCGNLLAAAATLQDDSQCNMGCSYNSSEACGGPNLLTVYYANKPAPQGPFTNPGPPGWTSYGCWTDGAPRTLANAVQVTGGGDNMTVAACTSACSAAGYTLAGK